MNKNNKFVKGLKWFGKSYLWLIPLFFIIDIVSKRGFENALWKGNYSSTITVIPGFFYFQVLHNTGAAWGIFSGNTWLLVTFSLVAGILMLGYLIKYYKKLTWWTKISLFFMIPGCLGNLVDRAFYDTGVIDFLKFEFGSYQFPTFNFADACLVIGAILLILGAIVEDMAEKKKEIKMQEEELEARSRKVEEGSSDVADAKSESEKMLAKKDKLDSEKEDKNI